MESDINMSRINEIQRKILELEGGAYQKLVDDYLCAKYKYPNIQPLGVQTGTNKPTKGIPDSYVYTENDKYILICYGSVKEQAARKIEKDILDCLDESKSFVSEDRIEKIICCFTSTNINIGQFDKLRKLLKNKGIKVELIGIGTLSQDLMRRFSAIASDHLGIPIDTHQIFKIEDFVKEYDKNGMNSPLATKFYFRETKLEEVNASVSNNFITVITGPSGIGKTRLALEVCRMFDKEGWRVFCVRSHGRPLYDDIHHYFDSSDRYLLFLDDANDVNELDNLLKFLLTLNNISELRVLVTVRDYAKRGITTNVSNYSNNEIELGNITDDEIKEILKNNYNIKNPEYLKAITDVANGNIRLAVLAGLRSIKSGLATIRNAVDIFKNYYNPIIVNVGLTKPELIYLCIISLIGPVKYKQDPFFQELINLHVNNVDEEETLEKLCDWELIDWFENEIVKITDQSFGNYILYHVIYEKQWVDLSFLIEKMLSSRREKIIYALNTLINLFYTSGVVTFIAENVNKAWENAEDNLENYYVESFYSVNPVKGLCYLKKYVTAEKTVAFDLKTFDIKSKLNYNNVSTKEIEVLTKYKRTEYFNEAIDLLLALYDKRPDLFMDLFFAIENNVIFDQHSLYNGYTYETEFLEKLWKSCKNGQKYNNTILYLYTAKEFLKTEFTFTNPERGRKISWGQMQVKVCDEIKSLRNIIWKSLSVIYDNPEYHELVLDLLSNIRIGGLEAEDRLELLQSDFETIYTIFENKETINFDDTLVLSHFKNLLAQFGKNDDRFTKLETCHEYMIYDLFTTDDLTTGSWKELEERRDAKILEVVRTYQQQDFNRMFQACSVIEKNGHGNIWALETGIAKVFDAVKNDKKYFADVLDDYFKNGAPYGGGQWQIVSYMVSNLGYEKTLEIINNAEFVAKDQWLYYLWIGIPEENITDDVAQDCISFQRQQFQNKDNPIIFSVLQIKRYMKYDRSILKEIVEFLISNPIRIHKFLLLACRDDEFLAIEEVFKDNMDLLENLYFACIKHDYDYDGRLFWLLYENNEIRVWEKIIAEIKSTYVHNDGAYYRSIFRNIWKKPNFSERIDYAFKELLVGTYGLNQDEMEIIFSKEKGDSDSEENKKKQWIWDKMDRESENLNVLIDLIDVVINIYPLWKNDILIHFLEIDKDVEHFKKLHLFKMIDGWVGSEIPEINKKIDSLKNLNSKIVGIDYIEHKGYLEETIEQLQKSKKSVEIQEYIENGMY